MNNYRLEIEQLILNTILEQDKTHDLDKIELEEYKLDYELFKSNRTHKLVAKAIVNLQEDDIPVSTLTVEEYISKRTEFDEKEMLSLTSTLWTTYDTMLRHVKHLKDIDKEQSLKNTLKAV